MSLMTVKAYISQFGFFKSNYIVPAETHFRTHGLQERWWGCVQRKEGYHRYITPNRVWTKLWQKTKILLQEDIIAVNGHIPNTGVNKYIKQTSRELKGEIDSNTVIRNSSTPCSTTDRTTRPKVNVKTKDLKLKTNLADIYRRHIFFKCTESILWHKPVVDS